MKAAWIIAAREVREKARLFLICAALAVVPFAATLLPGTRGNAQPTIALVGGFLAAIVGLGVATALGVSTIAGDLSERRMSFYFTKPLSAPAIWIGKACAGLFISLGCAAIIAVPAVLASRLQWRMYWLGEVQPLAVLAIGIVVLFFLTHVLSSVTRSRSPLLALDFLFLVVAAGAVYYMVVPLILGGAVELVQYFAIALAAALLLVLALAPVWQLANGRSDIRRSHAALMRFLWPSIGIVLLIAGGVVAWVVRVSPEDVDVWDVAQPLRGSRLTVMGNARNRFDYQAAFLIDRATGRVTRIGAPTWWRAQFSDDGRVVLWSDGLRLHTGDGPTSITVPQSAGYLLSDDGARVAVLHENVLSVYELATGKLLASAAGFDGGVRQQMYFITPDLVRVVEHRFRLGGTTPLRMFELDVRARKMRQTGERIVESSRNPVSVSGDGSRMFIRGAGEIADARTGDPVAKIAAANVTHSEMLHDGRVALITLDRGVPHLRVFGPDGTLQQDVAFPGRRTVWIAAETDDGKLILAAYGKVMLVVNLATGAVERELPGLRGPMPRWFAPEPRLARFGADQELAAIDAKGKLVLWNAARPSARPLAREGAP